LKTKWNFPILAASVVALGVVAYWLGIEQYRKSNPEAAFVALVGTPVPSGVRVIKYASAVTDNIFHTTHFWLLEGDPDSLRKVATAPRFGRSDEDARWFLPEAGEQFKLNLTPEDLTEGYESDDPRNRWFFIFARPERAIYAL
jgi:hypothetical protein